jgi:hypothetical protein
MQSNCAAKRDNRGDAGGAAKHDREASYQVTNVNALLGLLTHVVWSGAVKPPNCLGEAFWRLRLHRIFFTQNAFLDVQVGWSCSITSPITKELTYDR